MKIFVAFAAFFLTAGMLAQQPPSGGSCGFSIQGTSNEPAVTGPDDLVPLVHVLEQPDSPISIVAVDLTGMWLSVFDGRRVEKHCGRFTVRNRSDRTIPAFVVSLDIRAISSGGGFGASSSSPLPPGETVEIGSCNSGGQGGAPNNHVQLLAYVGSVDLGDCFYRPSLRLPRSLGISPIW